MPRRSLRGRRVLVTGGSGFLGSHLVGRLLREGVERAVVLDEAPLPESLQAAAGPVEHVRVTLGASAGTALREALEGVEGVFHFAARKHRMEAADPIGLLRANVEGTHALVEAAREAGAGKVVFASSLYVYGRTRGPAYVESEIPAPRTLYGISKLAGEHLLARAGERGLETVALRFLFTYGPQQGGEKSVIVKNLERMARGEAPAIHGDGEQALDYVYVDDAVEAAVRAMEGDVSGEIFNVASGRAVSVSRLVETLAEVTGVRLAPLYEAADSTAGTFREGNADAIRRRLGWEPRVPLLEGLRRTYEWVRAG